MELVTLTPVLAFRRVTEKSDKIGKLINWWCNSTYYHVELIIEDHWISATPDKAIMINDLKPLDHESYDYLTLPEVTITKKTYDDFWKFIKSIDGKPYNMYGLLYNQVIGFNIYFKTYFCSELVIEMLQYLGYGELFGRQSSEFSPQDVYDIFTTTEPDKLRLRRRAIVIVIKKYVKIAYGYIKDGCVWVFRKIQELVQKWKEKRNKK